MGFGMPFQSSYIAQQFITEHTDIGWFNFMKCYVRFICVLVICIEMEKAIFALKSGVQFMLLHVALCEIYFEKNRPNF